MAYAPLRVMGRNTHFTSEWHKILFALIFVFFLVINLAKVSQTTKQISEEIFEPPKKL